MNFARVTKPVSEIQAAIYLGTIAIFIVGSAAVLVLSAVLFLIFLAFLPALTALQRRIARTRQKAKDADLPEPREFP
jgi:Flp pilus assembly protein TadB